VIIDPSEFASVDPERFAALVRRASRDELGQTMSGPDRDAILREIFSRFPTQFRPDRAGETDAVIHWRVGGRTDGGSDTFEVVIADGTCVVSPDPAGDPTLTVTLGGAELLQLLSGTANPMTMFLTGKLKAKGDFTLAANLANLFDLPKG
jgi:hypothetical protein